MSLHEVLLEMNQYTRVTATPGKSYLCGCDLQNANLGTWQAPRYVTVERCRVHDQPVAAERSVVEVPMGDLDETKVAARCDGCTNVWCVCNRVPEAHA